jgi:DNA-binding Lrp family transcriptional regulator
VSVINAVHLTGPFDMQLRVAARDVAELNELLQALKDDLGAAETNTRLVLNTVEGFPRPVAV